jgi:D-sedoheptulose 7-phosphate isomerase
MAADLNKGLSDGNKTRFRAICLNDSVPEMLAYAIDVSYNDVCVEHLKSFFNPEDVVIGISGSGKSENVLRAIEYANIKDMQKTEDVFPMLGHMAYQMLADD